jgi:hypothetical protein
MHGLVIFVFVAAAFAQEQDQMRYSVTLTEEGMVAPDAANLIVLEPSFAYRHGDRWRFSTSLAAVTRAQDETQAQIRVRETYFGLSVAGLDVTIGKRLVRWGAGYAFTATGILDPPRVATDPTDRLNLHEGREMATADWISGKHDLTVAWAMHRPGMPETTALRYNVLVDGFDTAVIVAHERGGATFTGANFTRVFGEAVELHGEFAWRERAAALFGGKYTTRSGITAIAEFYTPASITRQHYGFVRVSKSRLRELPGWKEWDLAASLVANLDDRSHTAVFDAGRRLGNHFYGYAHAEAPAGKRVPYSALVSIGVTFQL